MAFIPNVRIDSSELVALLDRAIAQLSNPHQMQVDIGAKLEANANLRFDTKTDPTGAAWAPLSPVTKAIYESDWFIEQNPDFKGGIPGSLLERTRQLRDSLGFNAGTDYVDIGTNRATKGGAWQIGFLHEFGTKTMPRRGILTADPTTGTLGAGDEADVLAIVEQALLSAFD